MVLQRYDPPHGGNRVARCRVRIVDHVEVDLALREPRMRHDIHLLRLARPVLRPVGYGERAADQPVGAVRLEVQARCQVACSSADDLLRYRVDHRATDVDAVWTCLVVCPEVIEHRFEFHDGAVTHGRQVVSAEVLVIARVRCLRVVHVPREQAVEVQGVCGVVRVQANRRSGLVARRRQRCDGDGRHVSDAVEVGVRGGRVGRVHVPCVCHVAVASRYRTGNAGRARAGSCYSGTCRGDCCGSAVDQILISMDGFSDFGIRRGPSGDAPDIAAW